MATIYHQVWINARGARVYRAIADPEAIGTWWDRQTPIRTDASLVLEHSPGPEHGVVKLKVLETIPDRRVEWECVSTHPASSPASGWTGTRMVFEVSDRTPPAWMAPAGSAATMAVLDFRHSGWREDSPYLGFCSFAWGMVLGELKRVCESPEAS